MDRPKPVDERRFTHECRSPRPAAPRRTRQALAGYLPIVLGLPEAEAAASIGISPTKFREMVSAGLMPRPRDAAGKLSYDIDELRAAYKALPHRGDDNTSSEETDTWADLKPRI